MIENSLYYFAYGSNLHPLRLIERVPSAKLCGTAMVTGYTLAFHKKGVDSSGKCTIVQTDSNTDGVYGAVFKIAREHQERLDSFESLNKGYLHHQLQIHCMQRVVECFTYIAQEHYIDKTVVPYDWYKLLVVLGASYHGFPEEYIDMLKQQKSQRDCDADRVQRHKDLISRIKAGVDQPVV